MFFDFFFIPFGFSLKSLPCRHCPAVFLGLAGKMSLPTNSGPHSLGILNSSLLWYYGVSGGVVGARQNSLKKFARITHECLSVLKGAGDYSRDFTRKNLRISYTYTGFFLSLIVWRLFTFGQIYFEFFSKARWSVSIEYKIHPQNFRLIAWGDYVWHTFTCLPMEKHMDVRHFQSKTAFVGPR